MGTMLMLSAKFLALSCLFANSWAMHLPASKARMINPPKDYGEFKERLTNLEKQELRLHKIYPRHEVDGEKCALKMEDNILTWYTYVLFGRKEDSGRINLQDEEGQIELFHMNGIPAIRFGKGSFILQRREVVERKMEKECKYLWMLASFLFTNGSR